ncbi:MAG: peptidase bacteriocin processing [Verrucomicrobiales bacterium]|nr:peptidase bacteriocin processing [Verrucomicrobiales bacterium]
MFLFPTLLLGAVFWLIGLWWAKRTNGSFAQWTGWVLVAVLALPGFFYVAYYSGRLGEPIWLYNLRSIPGSELLASLAGLVAGWIQVKAAPHLKLSATGRRILVPGLLFFGLALPYLKPVLRPLSASELRAVWEDGVCMQSSASTCGPASAATILRSLSKDVSEQELARESFSSGRGTENWYLARALRKRGLQVTFTRDGLETVQLPAIAGVKLLAYGSGHFVAVLGREGDRYLIGDPLRGRFLSTRKELEEMYRFTGFFMLISGR